MTTLAKPPSRVQLNKIAGGDFELVRALEKLFEQALQLTPTEVTELVTLIQANTSSIVANAGAIDQLEDRVDDLTLNDLANVDAASPTLGMVLIYDATAGRWEANTITAGSNIAITNGDGTVTVATTGASGSFTAQSGETVTVSNGIITSIV